MDLADQVFITGTTLVLEEIRTRRSDLPHSIDEVALRESSPPEARPEVRSYVDRLDKRGADESTVLELFSGDLPLGVEAVVHQPPTVRLDLAGVHGQYGIDPDGGGPDDRGHDPYDRRTGRRTDL
jgi:hypothetical protein